jgi:hypothetical protein
MQQLELNNRIAAVVGTCESELRSLVLEAARHLATVRQTVEDDITIPLEDGMSACINGFKGAVQIAGQHVGDLGQLLKILDGLHRVLGQPVNVKPTPAVEAPTVAELPVEKATEDKPEARPLFKLL